MQVPRWSCWLPTYFRQPFSALGLTEVLSMTSSLISIEPSPRRRLTRGSHPGLRCRPLHRIRRAGRWLWHRSVSKQPSRQHCGASKTVLGCRPGESGCPLHSTLRQTIDSRNRERIHPPAHDVLDHWDCPEPPAATKTLVNPECPLGRAYTRHVFRPIAECSTHQRDTPS